MTHCASCLHVTGPSPIALLCAAGQAIAPAGAVKAPGSSAGSRHRRSRSSDKGDQDGLEGDIKAEDVQLHFEDPAEKNVMALVEAEVKRAVEALRSNHEGEQAVMS